jgi:hypothetical protein
MDEEPLCVFHDMVPPVRVAAQPRPLDAHQIITNLEQTKQRFPDNTVTGMCLGSRSWLPITMGAIARNVDFEEKRRLWDVTIATAWIRNRESDAARIPHIYYCKVLNIVTNGIARMNAIRGGRRGEYDG